MKKSIIALISAITVALTFMITPQTVFADYNGNYTYTVDSEGNATITDYYSYDYENISIPDTITDRAGIHTVKYIGDRAFADCYYLTGVTIPASVVSIGANAFYGCHRLTGVNISNGVESIGNSAFYGCSSLIGIAIPDTIASIGEGAFTLCSKLKAIDVSSGNTEYSSVLGILYDKSKTTLVRYPSAKSGSSFAIPNGVISIDDYAFYGCNQLTNVTIPNSVTTIGYAAFADSNYLTSITIPSNVESIGDLAFAACKALNKINAYPISNPNAGINAFKGISSQAVLYIQPESTGYYNAPWSVLKQDVLERTLEEISVTAPTKTQYIIGQDLDTSGLVVMGRFNYGTDELLPSSRYNLSGFDSSKPATGQKVTVTVDGKTTTFNVNIVANSLQSLAIIQPTNTDYIVGQSLDIKGLVVTGNYLDGSKKELPVSMNNISGFDSSYAISGQKVTVTVDGKTATFIVNIAELPKALFNDTVGHWASEYITDLSSRKIINGYSDNTFRPENLISREEAAQMLSNYIGGSGGSAEVPYDSIGRWSSPAIQNLISKRIISGYEDGSFRPQNQITRAEFSTMVYNMMSSKGQLGPDNRSFDDTAGHWAQNSIGTLAGNGIINGYDDGSFRPDSNITRAEAATIISKSLSK